MLSSTKSNKYFLLSPLKYVSNIINQTLVYKQHSDIDNHGKIQTWHENPKRNSKSTTWFWPTQRNLLCYFRIKSEAVAQSCSVKFVKFLRTPFLTEHLRWLLLWSDGRGPYSDSSIFFNMEKLKSREILNKIKSNVIWQKDHLIARKQNQQINAVRKPQDLSRFSKCQDWNNH